MEIGILILLLSLLLPYLLLLVKNINLSRKLLYISAVEILIWIALFSSLYFIDSEDLGGFVFIFGLFVIFIVVVNSLLILSIWITKRNKKEFDQSKPFTNSLNH